MFGEWRKPSCPRVSLERSRAGTGAHRGFHLLNIQSRAFLTGFPSLDGGGWVVVLAFQGPLIGCALSAGHATSASRCSKLPSSTKSGWPRQNEKKPSEVGNDECPDKEEAGVGKQQERRPVESEGVNAADAWGRAFLAEGLGPAETGQCG